jgi:hypothetical protein
MEPASKALFVTLTYPAGHNPGPKASKRDLARFKKRLERKYGKLGVIWKIEFGEGGVPYYHLLVILAPSLPISRPRRDEMRTFIALAWYEACGKVGPEHLQAGTRVERPRSLLQTMKYMNEPETLTGQGAVPDAGRRWGALLDRPCPGRQRDSQGPYRQSQTHEQVPLRFEAGPLPRGHLGLPERRRDLETLRRR